MIRAVSRYNVLIPTPTETVSASPPHGFPAVLSERVPIRGLGLMLFDAVEELSHHEEEDASFISRQLLVILLVHDLYQTYPIMDPPPHATQHEHATAGQPALADAHALTGFDIAAEDYIARMHSPKHDGISELEACYHQLTVALADSAVSTDWTTWFVQEFVRSRRFRINGGASEETARSMVGEVQETLTWVASHLVRVAFLATRWWRRKLTFSLPASSHPRHRAEASPSSLDMSSIVILASCPPHVDSLLVWPRGRHWKEDSA